MHEIRAAHPTELETTLMLQVQVQILLFLVIYLAETSAM
jgi:hypothetical protein